MMFYAKKKEQKEEGGKEEKNHQVVIVSNGSNVEQQKKEVKYNCELHAASAWRFQRHRIRVSILYETCQSQYKNDVQTP